jgi:hypothetical protein
LRAGCRTAVKSSFGIAWSGPESEFLRPTDGDDVEELLHEHPSFLVGGLGPDLAQV